MSKERDELIGRTLGQYTIIEEIGRGGMATVYRATQQSMSRMVAIKVLPRHLLHDPSFLERFEREVEVISQLEHPHILPIYDYGHSDGVPFIAMRYLGGGSMADLIHKGVPDMEQIEQPLRQIAQALDYAHKQGVIHRDLKPGNIMLDENGNAYLSDFGIARVMGSDLTGSAIIGTPAYMSPEQAHGVAIDSRSDIYALGIVLFELLTGREPFQAETPMGMLLMHIKEPLPSLQQIRREIPAEIEAVVIKATAKIPDVRYSSAGEMSRAMTEALRGKGRTRPNATRPNADARISTNVNQSLALDKTVGLPAAELAASPPNLSETLIDGKPPARNYAGMALFVVVLGLALFLGFGLLTGLFNSTGNLESPLTPTPFRNAVSISVEERYSISIPERWLPPLNDYVDASQEDVLQHEWSLEDENSYVRLSIYPSADYSVAALDAEASSLEGFSLIDQEIAPNGTLRRSYRVNDTAALPNGQLDRFFIEGAESLSLLEFYISDASAGTPALINTLQAVLDSLRLA